MLITNQRLFAIRAKALRRLRHQSIHISAGSGAQELRRTEDREGRCRFGCTRYWFCRSGLQEGYGTSDPPPLN